MESTVYTVSGRAFELKHHGVKGMRWGVRNRDTSEHTQPRSVQPQYQPAQQRSYNSTNPHTKMLIRNSAIVTNRLMQMGMVGGLSAAGSRIAKRRGKKVVAATLSTIGTLSVAGFTAAMVTELVKNDGGDV